MTVALDPDLAAEGRRGVRGVVLDAGALIAVDRDDRSMLALIRRARRNGQLK